MPPRKFAEGTSVAPEKSRLEIEQLVRKYGADEYSGGWIAGQAAVQFRAHGRRVRFTCPLPTAATGPRARQEAEERRLWRCLLLAIKAKLEVVASGIASFEEEFLAHIVVEQTGKTIYEAIQLMKAEGQALLPAMPDKKGAK